MQIRYGGSQRGIHDRLGSGSKPTQLYVQLIKRIYGMKNQITMTEADLDLASLRESLSNWKEDALKVVAKYPKGTNFFVAESYFQSSAADNEPLLLALIPERATIEALTERRFCQPCAIREIVDFRDGEIRFRFVTHHYPFEFAEKVLGPLCQDPGTAIFTRFVNARKKGFSEKHTSSDHPEVRSTAYWGIKRKASLPLQQWAYDITQCDPEREKQTYSRNVFPLLTQEHMDQYQRTGRICEDKDYQFFLDGTYSYIDLTRSWEAVKDLEDDWEELNAHLGSNSPYEESCE